MYTRAQNAELLSRIKERRGRIQVILGPRQVGKSTLVKQVLSEITIPYLFVSADSLKEENPSWISTTWESARNRMKLGGLPEFLLVIDEIQKIPNWSEAVKKEWDQDTFYDINIKVVVLGSSRLLIMDGLTESLAGRFEIIRMSHWSFPEMRDAFGFTLEEYIYFGGYPGGAELIRNESRWRRYIKDSIIAPAIELDVLTTKNIYKPELMRRLFELGCSYSGKEISLRKLLGQLQDVGNVTTLSSYLTTLKEAQLLCGLQKYSVDTARKYSSIPKMMVYNTSLLSALSSSTFKTTFIDPILWGHWVETAVGAFLLNKADEEDFSVYYWREKDNEVDFIVQRRGECVAIEVKSGHRTTNKGLQVFKDSFHPKHAFVVGSGGIPLEDFFLIDIRKLF